VCKTQRLCLGEITCKVAGHTAPIRNIDWGGDSRHFQTNSENHELRFWKLIKPERKAWTAEELRAKQLPDDLSWSSWTCPMGWPVLGIQPTDGMGPRIDISVHSIFNHNGSLLICGDPSCCITLTRFPCPSMDQMRKVYKGHCSPIIAVQFIAGGFKVASCGKSDSCIVQWKIINEPEPIETKEKITGPVVVLHGDVSSKHEAKCAICSDANNKYSILEEIQAKAVKEMLPVGGDYGGDLEKQLQAYQKEMEDQGGTEIPALPLDSDMIQLNGWSDEISAQTPLEDIELEHVFGYQGSDRKCNAKLLRTCEIIYTAGCIAIVSNMSSRQQRQFIHHLSPIVSFAVHPDKLTICSASNGPRPSIFIWDSLTMEVQHNLRHCFPEPGYSIVAFGGHSGEKVLVVGNDDFHSLAAIMWKTEDVLVMGTGTQVCFFVSVLPVFHILSSQHL
jgi:WD40 repeat protein